VSEKDSVDIHLSKIFHWSFGSCQYTPGCFCPQSICISSGAKSRDGVWRSTLAAGHPTD